MFGLFCSPKKAAKRHASSNAFPVSPPRLGDSLPTPLSPVEEKRTEPVNLSPRKVDDVISQLVPMPNVERSRVGEQMEEVLAYDDIVKFQKILKHLELDQDVEECVTRRLNEVEVEIA